MYIGAYRAFENVMSFEVLKMNNKKQQKIRNDNLRRAKDMARLREKYKDVSLEDINAQTMEKIRLYAEKKFGQNDAVANNNAYEEELTTTHLCNEALQQCNVDEGKLESMKLMIEGIEIRNKNIVAEENAYWEEKVVQEKKLQQKKLEKVYEKGRKIRKAGQKVAEFFKTPFCIFSK